MKSKVIFFIVALLLICENKLVSQNNLAFDIEDTNFLNFLENFINCPVNNLIDSLILMGEYYDIAKEEKDYLGKLVSWELIYIKKGLSIFIYVGEYKYIDPSNPLKYNYPDNDFNFDLFQKEKISQILIRKNISINPGIESYYKWVSLPIEKEKKKKKEKK